jgi:hypothetical protein
VPSLFDGPADGPPVPAPLPSDAPAAVAAAIDLVEMETPAAPLPAPDPVAALLSPPFVPEPIARAVVVSETAPAPDPAPVDAPIEIDVSVDHERVELGDAVAVVEVGAVETAAAEPVTDSSQPAWMPKFASDDDIGDLLDADTPMLARAFRNARPRQEQPGPDGK